MSTMEDRNASHAAPIAHADGVIDVGGLALLTHIPAATILTLRCRAPDRLPPPFRRKPLLWRTRTVLHWMEEEEQREAQRIRATTAMLSPRR